MKMVGSRTDKCHCWAMSTDFCSDPSLSVAAYLLASRLPRSPSSKPSHLRYYHSSIVLSRTDSPSSVALLVDSSVAWALEVSRIGARQDGVACQYSHIVNEGRNVLTAVTRFWMQAAFHLFTALGFLLFYWPKKNPNRPRLTFKQIMWEIDPIGSLLFISAATTLLLAFDWAGGAYDWSDPHVAAPLGIGFGLFVLFGLYEWKGRDDGIVAHVFFKGSPNFALSCFAFAVEGWIFYSAVNSITPQIVLHLGFSSSSWIISLRQLSFNCVTIIASIPITLYATKYKDLKWPLIGEPFDLPLLTYQNHKLTQHSNLRLLPHHHNLLRLHHPLLEQSPNRPQRHLRHRSSRPSHSPRRTHPVHRPSRLSQHSDRAWL